MKNETYSDKELAYRIHKMNFLLERRIERVLALETELSFAQFKTLMALGHDPDICASQIADYLGLTEAAISRQINMLVEQGFLDRHESPENRRKFQLTVTARGKTATTIAGAALQRSLREVFEHLDEADRSLLGQKLDGLMQSLCSKDPEAKENHTVSKEE